MNNLQLVRALYDVLRAGQQSVASGAPDTLAGATGVPAELAGFIRLAWHDIQNDQPNWRFMRRLGSLTLQQGSNLANPALIPDFESIIVADSDGRGRFITLFRDSPEDEQTVRYVPYEQWAFSFLQRGQRGTGQPAAFTLLGDGQLQFDMVADFPYTLRFDYRRMQQELLIDADTPIMPARFHMLIVWWAVVHYYCLTRDGSTELRQKAEVNLRREKQKLVNEQLDEVGMFEISP
jgi:hypothetical protein